MKAVPLYLAMVGIPIAVLIPVLRAGRGLFAPPAVAGEWWPADGGPGARIAQSGRFVEIELIGSAGRATLKGRLDGARLRASGPLPATYRCGARPITLHVEFGPGARPDSAVMSLDGGESCLPAPRSLRRAPAPPRRREGH